jgi:hypothetical protein
MAEESEERYQMGLKEKGRSRRTVERERERERGGRGREWCGEILGSRSLA